FILRKLHITSFFPYTTLFRSDRGRESLPPRDERVAREEDRLPGGVHRLGLEHREVEDAVRAPLLVEVRDAAGERQRLAGLDGPRSEEHTSELQSRSDLVCRLL